MRFEDLAGLTVVVWGAGREGIAALDELRAVIAKESGIPADTAIAQHLYATLISLTQNAVRGIPLGQNTGQRIIFEAQTWVEKAVVQSRKLGMADFGAVAFGLEIAQMKHERQRARLFMS